MKPAKFIPMSLDQMLDARGVSKRQVNLVLVKYGLDDLALKEPGARTRKARKMSATARRSPKTAR